MSSEHPQSDSVMIGLSGGVDSAVAALLLKQQGLAVTGLFMKNWEEDDEEGYCAAAEDLADARAVADRLDIELLTVNFSSEYWDRVFEHFLSEYRASRTPNPDILCNSEIKFRAFLDFALAKGAGRIATGHYARLERHQGLSYLRQAADPGKDQTYFLHRLNQWQLSHSLFPLGDLPKTRVREMAERAGFANHAKKDSTGICFIGERRFRDFLARYLPATPGEIQTPDGQRIGEHQGLMYYTIGQRQGLGIGGLKQASDQPWFVAAKDLEHNVLIAVQGHDHPLLLSPGLLAGDLSWCSGEAPPAPEFRCQARIRHRGPLQWCRLMSGDGGSGSGKVLFDEPQRAVAPGQSAVFYQDGRCLGGGVIERALRD